MSGDWHNFLYNSFDPAGFVSIDKPPVAFWVQVASVKLLGFSGSSLILPQILEGLAAIWLLYHLVRRRFGTGAGLLAGLFLAITPVSVAIDRTSNTDSCLVLVLLLAAWALTHAVEKASRPFLLLAMALVGIGFNVKMLAAFVVLPIFALVYFVGAPVDWRRRLVDLTISGIVLMVVSLSWVLAYDLTPAARRPFAGSSHTNSMVELALGHNAAERFVRRERRGGAARFTPAARPDGGNSANAGTLPDGSNPANAGAARRWRGMPMDRVPVGPLRLADPHLAGQTGWLFPLALMGLALGAPYERARGFRSPNALALVLWFGWALSYAVVYSYAGGIFHAYYLSTMAPPVAALAGIGVMASSRAYLRGGWRVVLLPAALIVTAAWQIYVQAPFLGWTLDPSVGRLRAVLAAATATAGDWRTWLLAALIAGTVIVVLGLLAMALLRAPAPPPRRVTAVLVAAGLAALLVTPSAWALSTVLVRGNVVLPSADLSALTLAADGARAFRGGFSRTVTQRLTGFLLANRHGERFLFASTSTRLAAPIIVATGESVMARGGFFGRDPILTPERLARMAETGQVRFVMIGDGMNFRGGGADDTRSANAVDAWVRANGTLLDPTLWRSVPAGDGADGRSGRRGEGRMNLELYDLHPSAGVMAGPRQ